MNKQQKLEIVELYKTMPTSEIAEIYGVTGACIRWNLKSMGVKLLPKGNRLRLPSEEISLMYSSGMNCREISERYECTPLEISRSLRKSGYTPRSPDVAHRTTTINENCLDEITEESAYWIGFLMADGANIDGKGVSVGLASVDEKHIDKFKAFFGTSRKTSRRSFINASGNRQYAVSTSVSSKKISRTLSAYGVVPRKTGIESAHESLRYNRHFWRGEMDGDGSIRLTGDRSIAALQFCGSLEIVQQFCDFVKSIFPKSYMKPLKVKNANCYRCSTGYKRAIGIIRVLYSDCSIFLDRKKEIADKILTTELPPDRTRKLGSRPRRK